MVLSVAITFELRGIFDAIGGGACAAKENMTTNSIIRWQLASSIGGGIVEIWVIQRRSQRARRHRMRHAKGENFAPSILITKRNSTLLSQQAIQ